MPKILQQQRHFHGGFQESVEYDYPIILQGWANFASQYRLYDAFYNSFAEDDERDDRILTKYVDSHRNLKISYNEQIISTFADLFLQPVKV